MKRITRECGVHVKESVILDDLTISDSALIKADYFEIGKNSYIGHNVEIKGGRIVLGEGTKIEDYTRINVKDLKIGDRALFRPYVLMEGYEIDIGTESYFDEHAHVGGGSSFDLTSKLVAGDFLHMGKYSHLNPAMGMEIGHEFGCGIGTKVFTHGAYTSAWDGFPVQWSPVKIGDNVWLPNAWVNPGVTLEDDIVVSAMSLVNKNLPKGCLAVGSPAKVLRENVYPRKLTEKEGDELFKGMLRKAQTLTDYDVALTGQEIAPIAYGRYKIDGTSFDLEERTIEGPVTKFTEVLKNQLRRNGIRFRYKADRGEYVPW